MANSIDLATSLFGNKRLENGEGTSVNLITGTATSNSKDGKVSVVIDGTVVADDYDSAEENNVIELDTNPSVNEGDVVQITEYGGTSKSMVVTGVIGDGDKITSRIADTKTGLESEITQTAKDLTTKISDTKSGLESQITQTATDIRSEVKAGDDALGTQITQTAEGLTVKINTAQDTADTAKTNAATAQTTANTAKTNAATAQTTANTAKTAAANAQTSADNAQTSADDAKKVATNYLSFNSTDGLVVGDMTASTLKGNTQISSSGVNVRKGTATLASFGASKATIGAANQGQIVIVPSSITIKDKSRALFNLNSTTFKDGTVFSTLHSGGTTLISVPCTASSTPNQIVLGFKESSTGYIADTPSIGITQGSSDNDFSVKADTMRISVVNLKKNGGEVYGETVLFNNASQAFNSSVTLSSSCTGYTYLDVYAMDNNSQYIHQRVYNPIVGRKFSIMSLFHDTGTYIKCKSFTIQSATKIETLSSGSGIYSCGEYNLSSFTQSDVIKITRVVGVK
jgi:hypothetical protein